MNSRLERVLNRISTKQILYERQRNQEQDKEHQLEVADKELENATKQLAFYKIELDRTKEKVEDANDASVMEDLNAQLKEAETRNKKLIKAIKQGKKEAFIGEKEVSKMQDPLPQHRRHLVQADKI